MLIGSCLAVAATVLVVGLAPARAEEGAGKPADMPFSSAARAGAFQVARQAPVGHRQPRMIDGPAMMPPADPEQQRLDQEIDRKLQICRGC